MVCFTPAICQHRFTDLQKVNFTITRIPIII